MGELDAQLGALGVHQLDDGRERIALVIIPQAQVLRADPAFRHHAGGLHDHPTCTSARERTVVHQVPGDRDPILLVNNVLAHRGYPDAVADLQSA